MEQAEKFYPQLHAEEKTYAAGTYYLPSLLASPALRHWASRLGSDSGHFVDVGCGKGLFLRDFLRALVSTWRVRPSKITGLDLVRSQDDLFHEISADFRFVQMNLDGQRLPFDDSSLAFLCCNHVLEHIFETERLVKEFRRVVKPEGLCLISVPNLAAWINRFTFLFAGQPLGSELGTEKITYGYWPRFLQPRLAAFRPSGHIRDFTPRSLADLTEHCGFRKVGWWAQSYGPIARLGKWAGRNIGILLVPK